MQRLNILCGDAVEQLRTLPDRSVNCCITSPPYYGLRDYGVDGQIGLEATPEQYIQRLVDVFREVRRVLRDDGTLWVNIADSYAGSQKGAAKYPDNAGHYKQGTNRGLVGAGAVTGVSWGSSKPKELMMIPARLALALSADGWYLRQDIIWHKPNPMPESVTDRCTKAHEYIYLLSKSKRYYFDAAAIAEPVADSSIARYAQDIEEQAGYCKAYGKTNGPMKAVLPRYGGKKYTATPDVFCRTKSGGAYDFRPMRNKRSVWTVSTAAYSGAHFATFPPELVRPCIRAACPDGGTVLDCFLGSGTTGEVALQENRRAIGIELNPQYAALAHDRCDPLAAQQTIWR